MSMSSAMSVSSECSLLSLMEAVQLNNGSLSKPATSAEDSAGEGVFVWSSGLQYTGEYLGRKRHGHGVQLWPDGARYEGNFHEDQRHGSGRYSWSNGEEYVGEYQWDMKHGKGTYSWPTGAHLTGQFRRDCKEGQCVYFSADGNKFEGMYHDDVRDGEGVLTYPGGRQDVGTWQGKKLIQLTFTVLKANFDPASSGNSSSKSSLASFDVNERGNYGPKGQLEIASEELIQAAGSGSVCKVGSLVKIGAVHVDVADRDGHTALFTAAVHNHPDVINVLLDNGADVNKLDSAGVSPLNACHHLLYCSLPQVKALLNLVPRLEYPVSQSSSPTHSTALSDCTLHTSDFMSNPPTPNSSSHSNLLHDHGAMEKCLECQGLCGMHSRQKHILNTDLEDTSQELNSETEEITGEAISVHLSPAPAIHTPLTLIEHTLPHGLEFSSPNSTPTSTSSEQISLSSALAGFDMRGSATASVGSDILGVSADNNSEFISLGTRFHGCEGGDISDISCLSLQDVSEISMLSSQNLRNSNLEGQLDNIEISRKAPSPLPGYLQPDSPLVTSSVFSSTQYGPIVSAAQSTTLSCGSGSMVECLSLSEITEESCSEEASKKQSTCVDTITVLLKRGANPNTSSLPLSPLVYAIRSGDLAAVKCLAERGADVNHPLPVEVGGHSPLIEAVSLVGPNSVSIVEVLINHGAHVNSVSPTCSSSHSTSTKEECESISVPSRKSSAGDSVMAGQYEGEDTYSPLHVICAHRELPDKSPEELVSTVLAIVDLLLGAGALVNVVARGHSPLSLAILNGYDTVVERLLKGCSDPNLPLGRGVGTALCCLVSVLALKKRDLTNSLKMVGQLIRYGANFTQPVKVGIGERLGSVTDFAYTALKMDKRLSCLKYSALNKTERARYRAWRKLLDNFVNLFKCKALHSVALRENAWLTVQLESLMDNSKLQIRHEKLFKTSSAIQLKHSLTYKKARHIQSAGGTPTKCKTHHLSAFPLHSLCAATRKVTKHHGLSLLDSEPHPTKTRVETPACVSKGNEKQRLQQIKNLFGSALEMFQTTNNVQEEPDETLSKRYYIDPTSPSSNQWTLSCFCYECGQCAVRLTCCPGCGYVYYCSQACRSESYKRIHRDECSGVFPRPTTTKTRKLRSSTPT